MAKDPFDSMSHESMLQWLDQANSGTVQGAAGRLEAAAKEIHSIAADLKVRPQWVNWKGSGAEAFRTWAGDLANATIALGDFSQDSSKWLGQAADAIARAQSSIPRDKASAQANLDAARSAHNDPDAAGIARKSSGELAAIEANKEKVRQEAALEMRKLGQSYSLSATQMGALPRPKFPPPPDAFVPNDGSSEDMSRQRPTGTVPGVAGEPSAEGTTATGSRADAAAVPSASRAVPDGPSVGHATVGPEAPDVPGKDAPPARMDIDSAQTLPDTSPARSVPSAPPAQGPTGQPPVTGPTAPLYSGPNANGFPGRNAPLPSARGSVPQNGPVGRGTTPGAPSAARGSAPSARGPQAGAQGVTGVGRPTGTGAPGRLPVNNGVAGGRPQSPAGKSGTSIPRGTVVGGTGRTTPSQAGGRAGGAASAGRSGARPVGGVVGGQGQQRGRSGARTSGSGGSGLVRGQGSGSGEGRGKAALSGGAGAPRGAKPRGRDENEESRPDYVVEDEATWQADDRRNVPPVVDEDRPKNSER